VSDTGDSYTTHAADEIRMLALHFFDRARDQTLVLQGDPSVAIASITTSAASPY